jgi:CHAT domain-containing protein
LSDVANADVIHLDVAAYESAEFPALSRLQLADDAGSEHSGSLQAERIARTEVVRAQIVALNGARRSKFSEDASATGLTRALLAAGVPAVVSSVAAVDQSQTENVWREFHRNVASGASVSDSLRRAQVTALREGQRRPGPWATLTVFGSTQ